VVLSVGAISLLYWLLRHGASANVARLFYLVPPVTALEGFPTKAELVARYEERSGREVGPLGWFEALALWKAAVFCEAIYGRFTRGELGAEDARAAGFEQAVPLMAATAAAALA